MKPMFEKLNFSKMSGVDLILIPHKIAHRCIKNAKTKEAKEILVRLVHYATIEDMKRIHVRGYRYKYLENTKAYDPGPSLMKNVIKPFWNKLFK